MWVSLVENGEFDKPGADYFVKDSIDKLMAKDPLIDTVILGCTHYPFVRSQIAQVLGDVTFFDGGEGTARQLQRLLDQEGLLREGNAGSVTFASSIDTPEELELYRWFYERPW